MAAILRVRTTDGTVIDIPAIKGADGDSAYDIAKDNGFEGTEEEWLESLKANVDANNILPVVTASDNGKFLRVVNGKWTASSVSNAEEASF